MRSYQTSADTLGTQQQGAFCVPGLEADAQYQTSEHARRRGTPRKAYRSHNQQLLGYSAPLAGLCESRC